jgi:hypothetical protein
MSTLELWNNAFCLKHPLRTIRDPVRRRRAVKRIQKERMKSAAGEMFPKSVENKGKMPVIKDQLPTIFRVKGHTPGQVHQVVLDALNGYRVSLPPALQSLLDWSELRDAAIKVVGVGSVGTFCFALLYMAGDRDPLFLQVREAHPSGLKPCAGASVLSNNGERAVNGCRLVQSANGMFLGWTRRSKLGRHFFYSSIEGRQNQRPGGDPRRRRDGALRPVVWTGAGPGPRTRRVCRHAQRIHGQERRIRPSHRRPLDGIRRSEPERSRRTRPRGSKGESEGRVRAGGAR